ncbi:MAG: hypothetical protein KY450_01405 [Actinobacteria bacterium]|nr:hypothetical protein [Actinomycetota bacterium]
MTGVGSYGALGSSQGRAQVAALCALTLFYAAIVAWLVQLPYDIAGGVLVAHLLALVTVPMLLWLERDGHRALRRLVVVGLGAKLVGTLARYAVLLSVYGEGDALEYDRIGTQLAGSFAKGDFSVDLGQRVIGTGFIEILTGLVYTVTGPTRLGGFLVYSWFGFWGLYLFFRAFRLACPDGLHRRYGLLLFFLPSMLFWPSSIGKDAWMTLMLGTFAYGAAALLTRRPSGVLWVVVGTAGSAMVRPHVTVIAVAALMLAYLLVGSGRPSYARPLSKVAGLAVLAVVFFLAFGAVENYLRLDEETSVDDVFDRTTERTSKGGSEFEAPGARSPAELPVAIFSVLFRPLPFEAANPLALFASLEGTFLLVLFIRHWRYLRNLVPRRRLPYLTLVASYSLMFAVAFSNVANFGILARQRTQLFPFVLVLLAVPLPRRKGAPHHAGTRRTDQRRNETELSAPVPY